MTIRKPLLRAALPIVAAASLAFSTLAFANGNTPIDLQFNGDALAALKALGAIDPTLKVLPPLGRPVMVPVNLNVQHGNTSDALQAIGEQGGSMLDVVYSSANNQVRLVYHSSATPPVQTVPDSALAASKASVKVDTVTEDDGTVRFPFGYGNPTVTCATLVACDIAMQPGETVKDAKTGDSERWIIGRADSGSGDTAIVHVVVKPKRAGLHTDLKVYTDRRTYTILLNSSEKEYMASVGFYYPQDSAALWGKRTNDAAADAQKESDRTIADMPNVRPDQLNLSYTIKGDKTLPWFPTRAFDDGSHVWIEMPGAMNHTEAPILMVCGHVSDCKDMKMVNYRIKPSKNGDEKAYFMVDKLFDHAVMIIGVGSDQTKVDIYKGNGPGFFSWASSH